MTEPTNPLSFANMSLAICSRILGKVPKVGMFWKSLAEKDGRTYVESARLKTSMAEERTALAGKVELLKGRVEKADASPAA